MPLQDWNVSEEKVIQLANNYLACIKLNRSSLKWIASHFKLCHKLLKVSQSQSQGFPESFQIKLLLAVSHHIMLNDENAQSPFESLMWDLPEEFLDLNITLLERLFDSILILPPYEFKIIVCASIHLLAAQNTDKSEALTPEFEAYFKRAVKVVVYLLANHPHISESIETYCKEDKIRTADYVEFAPGFFSDLNRVKDIADITDHV